MPRLSPSTTTITKLILNSSAKCAFPGCDQKLIENDQLIGQICHIEAASPGGERYNSSQTDEQRRSYNNLILLCANHHKITDNVEEYTVSKLVDMKQAHERQVEEEPALNLDELKHAISNIAAHGDKFSYTFNNSFTPYTEYEYLDDTSKAEAKLSNDLQNVQRVAGNSSATQYAQQIFGQELLKAKQPFDRRKTASDKMHSLELRKIDKFYSQLSEKEMSKIQQRGMVFSGAVPALEQKIESYKADAISELKIMYGKE
jgi:hypothetical protein